MGTGASDDSTAPQQQSIEASLERLFQAPPKLHRPGDFDPADVPTAEDGVVDWGIQLSFLRLLAELVTRESLTLETGSGLSTVCLAIIGAQHICISPFDKEHNRIRHYCAENGISTERIRFVADRSDHFLPSLDLGGRKLDFALIDGSHTFPEGIVDYYYVDQNLKVGGILVIDDLSISSVGLVHKFLMTDPAYQLIKIDSLKTGIYRKVAETIYPHGWSDQPINAKYPDFSYLPAGERVRNRLHPFEQKLLAGLEIIPGFRAGLQSLRRWRKKRR